MSRAVRLGIGLFGLIPVIGITGGALVAAGLDGLAVGLIAVGVGLAWVGFVIWWAMRAPKVERSSMWW